MFLVPKNLLMNLTSYYQPNQTSNFTYESHDSYALTSSLDISWLYNTSTSTTYQWWHRLDYNSQGDNYQIYDKVSDDLQCPEGDWAEDGYAGSIEGRLTQWFSNSTYLGVKRVTWE